ncbi:cell wall-associated NlpC family hydrolase [Pedobacter sp. CAN_A7]|jgi:lipoprotein Spr|uniref:C40 family peptidase n=1 Tax=Pedobacter sp. CAN_A7 TaxID=2787722 RepID=UPI0018C95C52
MKKTLALFCLVFLFTLTGKSQSKSPAYFKEAVQEPAVKLINFAKTLIGVPYRYASSSPQRGFDCSGFVNYVFQNLGVKVPRSSREFPKAGKAVTLQNAKVGDVLLFTGSNPKVRSIGHVGIVYSIDGEEIKFIHSSSGKAKGVVITEMDKYYKSRFIKAVSII